MCALHQHMMLHICTEHKQAQWCLVFAGFPAAVDGADSATAQALSNSATKKKRKKKKKAKEQLLDDEEEVPPTVCASAADGGHLHPPPSAADDERFPTQPQAPPAAKKANTPSSYPGRTNMVHVTAPHIAASQHSSPHHSSQHFQHRSSQLHAFLGTTRGWVVGVAWDTTQTRYTGQHDMQGQHLVASNGQHLVPSSTMVCPWQLYGNRYVGCVACTNPTLHATHSNAQ